MQDDSEPIMTKEFELLFQPFDDIPTYNSQTDFTQIQDVKTQPMQDMNSGQLQDLRKQLEQILQQVKQISKGIEIALQTAGLSSQQIQKIYNKKISGQQQQDSSQKKKPKEKQNWSIDEHEKLLELIKKYGRDNIKTVSALMDNRTETQVRSHLQKYYNKINKHFGDVQERMNSDKIINEFCVKYQQLPQEQKDQSLQQFLQQIKTKFFGINSPITTDIIATAIKQLKEKYNLQQYHTTIVTQNTTPTEELEIALEGMLVKNKQNIPIFVFPECNIASTQFQITETQRTFDVKNSSMSSIALQKKTSCSYTFNCNSLLQYCYKVIEQYIQSYELKQMITIVLLIQTQIAKVGDTFDYSIDIQCKNYNKKVEDIKLFMFCLRCALTA